MTAAKPQSLDPKNINARLYKQVAALLTQLETEEVSLKDRITAMLAIGRMQTIFLSLRLKGKDDEPAAGAAVRKYSTAFQTHDARRRKEIARLSTDDDTDGDDCFDLEDDRDSA